MKTAVLVVALVVAGMVFAVSGAATASGVTALGDRQPITLSGDVVGAQDTDGNGVNDKFDIDLNGDGGEDAVIKDKPGKEKLGSGVVKAGTHIDALVGDDNDGDATTFNLVRWTKIGQ